MEKTLNPDKKNVMKKEALERMKLIKLNEDVVRKFEEEDKIYQSEMGGSLKELSKALKDIVTKAEKEQNILVYHAFHSKTDFLEMIYLLCVSSYENDWEYDRGELKSGYPIACVINMTYPDCSELGSICIKPCNGGIEVIE